MSKVAPLLTDDRIAAAMVTDKPYKLTDGNGLYLRISSTRKGSGGKCWRFKYYFGGKEKLLALGVYPKMTIDDARNLCNDARVLLTKGIDPAESLKTTKFQEKAAEAASLLPSVRLIMGGGVEIWKGRAVVRLTNEEAQFVNDLLAKVTPCH